MFATLIALKYVLLVSQWSYGHFLKLTDSILFHKMIKRCQTDLLIDYSAQSRQAKNREQNCAENYIINDAINYLLKLQLALW